MILIYRFSETISIAIGKFLAATRATRAAEGSPLYPQLPNRVRQGKLFLLVQLAVSALPCNFRYW